MHCLKCTSVYGFKPSFFIWWLRVVCSLKEHVALDQTSCSIKSSCNRLLWNALEQCFKSIEYNDPHKFFSKFFLLLCELTRSAIYGSKKIDSHKWETVHTFTHNLNGRNKGHYESLICLQTWNAFLVFEIWVEPFIFIYSRVVLCCHIFAFKKDSAIESKLIPNFFCYVWLP